MADQPYQPDVSPPTDASADTLLEVIQTVALELHPHRQSIVSARLDSSLERELGFDSLGRVELLQRVERAFGVQLPDQLLATAETPRDLLRALTTAGARSRIIDASPARTLSLSEADAPPLRVGTLVEVLEWHVRIHPNRPHLYFYGDQDVAEEISYAQLYTGAAAVAAGLQERGLQHGQTVAIMLPTSLDFFYSFYGVLLAGGVPVPLYPPARLSQIEDHLRRQASILDSARASVLITVAEGTRLARLLGAQVEDLRSIVTVQELSSGGNGHVSAHYTARGRGVPAVHIGQHRYPQGRDPDPRQSIGQHPRHGPGGRNDVTRDFRELAAAVSRYGSDRRLYGQPVLCLPPGVDVAPGVSCPAAALAVGDSPAPRHNLRRTELCL